MDSTICNNVSCLGQYSIRDIVNIINNGPMCNLNRYGILKLYVSSDNQELVDLYTAHTVSHNDSITNNRFPNSGFDIFVPEKTVFEQGNVSKLIDCKIKGEMFFVDTCLNIIESSAYNVHPRSSISKTPLMLSNHTGIIDSGYRGFLMGAFRWLKNDQSEDMYVVDKHTRLLQICLPTLHPIFVIMVDEHELSNTTRGDGGFGSTGLVGGLVGGLTGELRSP